MVWLCLVKDYHGLERRYDFATPHFVYFDSLLLLLLLALHCPHFILTLVLRLFLRGSLNYPASPHSIYLISLRHFFQMRSSHLKLLAPKLFPPHHAKHFLKLALLVSPPLTPLPQFDFAQEFTQPVAWLAQEFDPLKSALRLQDLL